MGNFDLLTDFDTKSKYREIQCMANAFNRMKNRLNKHENEKSGLENQLIRSERLAATGQLADAIATGTDAALRRYDRDQRRHIAAWQTVVDYFYDGRFYAMLRLRNQPHDNWIGRLLGPHLGRHLPRVFTGESTASRYDPRLLQLVMKYSLGVLEDPDWARWRIR